MSSLREILLRRDISNVAKLTLLLLSDEVERRGECNLTQDQIGAALGIRTARQLRRHLTEMKKAGLIEVRLNGPFPASISVK